MSHQYNITLTRDSLFTPWGIRLEGGRDFNAPLSIQRVFPGSPASGELLPGDIIVSIQNRDACYLLHGEAEELIRKSGGSVHLTIRRNVMFSDPYQAPASSSSSSYYTYNAAPLEYSYLHASGDPSANYIRSRPIEKKTDPKPVLSQTGSPMMPNETNFFSYKPSHLQNHQQRYISAPATPSRTSHFSTTTTAAAAVGPIKLFNLGRAPSVNSADKRMVSQLQHSLNRAAHHVVASKHRVLDPYQHHQQQLQQFSKPNQVSFRLNSASATPAGVYTNSSSTNSSNNNQNNAMFELRNLQYNSPIGLYSQDNLTNHVKTIAGSQFEFRGPTTSF